MPDSLPAVSIVVPVYNEEQVLPALFEELERVAPALPQPVEFVFVDDGSTDGSGEILAGFRSQVAVVKVVELVVNAGQHPAVMAGLRAADGNVVVTLDADLQNPPSEIPKLVEKVREGYDVVAGWRRHRHDRLSRRLASWLMNRLVGATTGHHLHDYGCMLRAYSRPVVDAIKQCPERHTFLPVLANAFAKRVAEVEVSHAERSRGATKYSWSKLWRLNLDLLTGISTLPLHWVSLGGLFVALISLFFAVLLMVRRIIVGPEVEGVFTLFAILFFFIGAQIFATGLIAEYLTRIYDEVRRRPQYLIHRVVQHSPTAAGEGPSTPGSHYDRG
ncbi:MAG: glycosyltransferase [Armatimonadetes bacterium]|nr:glycosyltransferase [Armatimonadota bacterium]